MTSKKKILFIGAAVLALLAVAAYPAYKGFRNWRAEQLAAEALEALDKGDYAAASETARAAYYLSPENLEVVRTTARVAEVANPENAVEFWKQAADLSGRESEDLIQWAEAALASEQADLAGKLLEELPIEAAQTAQGLTIKALWQAAQGMRVEAAKTGRQAMQAPGAPDDSHFLYATLAHQSGDPELRQDAIAQLLKLGRTDDALGLRALRALVNAPELDSATLGELRQRLRSHPAAEVRDRRTALLIDEVLGDKTMNEVAEAAAQLYDTGSDADLVELARWLVQHGMGRHVQEHLPRERAMTRSDLFALWLDAVALEGKWNLILEQLDQPRTPLQEHIKQLYRMRAFAAQENQRLASLAWDSAVVAAARDVDKLWYLATYSLRLDLVDRARAVLWLLTEDTRVMRRAYQELLLLEQRENNTRELERLFQRMRDAYPRDHAVASDLVYIRALQKKELQVSLTEGLALVEAYPNHLPYRVSLAMVHMRLGEAEEAFELLQPVPVDWAKVRSRWQLVLAWVLVENGFHQESSQLLSLIQQDALLPEERALMNEVSRALASQAAQGKDAAR